MGRMFYIELNQKSRNELATLLKDNRGNVLKKWGQNRRVQGVLNIKEICPVFFINHFGSRVLDFFISVLTGEKEAGQCPVIIIMLKFFANRCMKLDEIYQICTGMKHSVIDMLLSNGIAYSDDKFATVIDMFDANFSGVIREYEKIMTSNHYSTSCDTKTSYTASHFLAEQSANADDSCTNSLLMEEYFAKDEDDYDENILFRTDDADDMLEYFSEIPERLSLALIHSDFNEIRSVSTIFSHTSSILLHYSPYLDTLAGSMSELATALLEHTEKFMEVLKGSENSMLRLFDAVSSDMDRYIQRFSVESIAMKNSHHIHEPTTLSIRQIITMFAPDQIEEGEIEFF